MTGTGQGGAAGMASRGMRCGVTGQPFTVLIPAGRAGHRGAGVSGCLALAGPSGPSAAAVGYVQAHGSVDHLIMLGSVVAGAVGPADPGGVAECVTDGGSIRLAASGRRGRDHQKLTTSCGV